MNTVRLRAAALLTLTCAAAMTVSAQAPRKVLEPKELREDFALLRSAFEKAHGGLYRHTPKEQMDVAFDRAAARLDHPMTDLEFFRIVAPVVDQIHDAHTALRANRDTLIHILREAKVFPFDVRYVDGRAFVEKNFSNDQTVVLGSEILAINGRAISEVTDRILIGKSADGFNRTPKYAVANINFWLYYYELVDDSAVFELELREPRSNAIRCVTVAGVPSDELQTAEHTPTHETFTLEFVGDGSVAVMTIPTFGDLDLVRQFADAFRAIAAKGATSLIIDIRGNGGGYDELNTELLRYLVPHPFRFYRRFTFRAKEWSDVQGFRYEPSDFFNMPDVKSHSEAELSAMLQKQTLAETLAYNGQTNPAAGVHQPQTEHPFRGSFYLLFDGVSGSSGGEVPALLHFLGAGTLIGEEPNASYQGTTAGILPTFMLPHSGIRASVPLIAYENAVLPGVRIGRGAPPHFVVGQTVEDALAHRDTAMRFALDLIAMRETSGAPAFTPSSF